MIRKFPGVASVTLSACGIIIISAEKDQAGLIEMKPTLIPEYFVQLKSDIETTRQSIVGTDKKSKLKQTTSIVNKLVDESYYLLKRIKLMIEVNFENDAAKETLDTLRFSDYYNGVVKGVQSSSIDLLSAISEHADELKSEFESYGLATAIIDQVVALSPKIIEANNNQEVEKNTKALTNEQIVQVNAIYKQVRDICKIANIIFADDDAKKRDYNFSKVVAGLN